MTADKLPAGTATILPETHDPDLEWELRIGFETTEDYKRFDGAIRWLEEALAAKPYFDRRNTLLTDRITTNPVKREREEREERRGVDEALAEVKKVLTKLTRRLP